MKQSTHTLVAVLLALSVGSGPVLAEDFSWRGSGGWGAGLPYGRLYDAAREQSLAGEITGFAKIVPKAGMSDGLQLLLKTRSEAVPVHLGPIWFLERQDFPLESGDQVEVAGARVTLAGKPVLIARSIRKGDKLLMLRDQGGFPLWSGWRRP